MSFKQEEELGGDGWGICIGEGLAQKQHGSIGRRWDRVWGA